MEPISVQPMREQVAAILRKAIFSGELKPGQELVQEEIANQLGISRMPVREAFQILERDGLITLQSHRKAVVRVLTDDEISDHYEIRALLEGEAAARAAKHPGDHEEILSAFEDTVKMADQGSTSEFVSANEAFHRSIWEASHSPRLVMLLNLLWNGLPPHLPELLPQQPSRSAQEHARIVEAIRAGHDDEARAAMTEHVLRSLGDFLHHRSEITGGDAQKN
ncbi:GntR family transcriptional regulator [Kyrpidia spormannii]|uniref:GntR family transcriptional regulator n=2 Tax=Kyrpidia spormannii TaxID=2055160 RepID=A0ACA8ZBE3_9BACL|nr:GntR family transcriptional regulator [Kyrpidia spormannii]CAB3392906.1 GntR family transcriptional regulator [Kyrpidia spormannii]CAB3393822.1 GntR family transcriptional regulator [Kyrpidia spormannii]HHY68209.1 GntR family transcriptional regulator [Alicyclobacillus sp.]